jgi:hypothetical protein
MPAGFLCPEKMVPKIALPLGAIVGSLEDVKSINLAVFDPDPKIRKVSLHDVHRPVIDWFYDPKLSPVFTISKDHDPLPLRFRGKCYEHLIRAEFEPPLNRRLHGGVQPLVG